MVFVTGTLLHHKWENAFPLDKSSWGFRTDMQLHEVYHFDEMLETVVSTVSCGGKISRNSISKACSSPSLRKEMLRIIRIKFYAIISNHLVLKL